MSITLAISFERRIKVEPNDVLSLLGPGDIQKIEKSFDLCLSEVFEGKIETFRDCANKNCLKQLHLRHIKLNTTQVYYLVQALQGTSVSRLVLSNNFIGKEGGKILGDALRLTNVTSLDVSWNNLGNEGANELIKSLDCTDITYLNLRYNNISAGGLRTLVASMPGTCLLDVDIERNSSELQSGLLLNQQKTIFTPYYILNVFNLSQEKKYNLHPNISGHTKKLTTNNHLEYAGGIVMNLPLELVSHILSFLPGMAAKLRNGKIRAENYVDNFKKRHMIAGNSDVSVSSKRLGEP